MKPAVAGMPARLSIDSVIASAMSGRLAAEPVQRADVVAERRLALAQDHDRERGDVREQVDGEVEEHRLDAEPGHDDDADEQVAGLRDRRVGEHPLQRAPGRARRRCRR